MKNEELILITNDDGFKSKGIKVLRSVAKKLSDIFGFLLSDLGLPYSA